MLSIYRVTGISKNVKLDIKSTLPVKDQEKMGKQIANSKKDKIARRNRLL